jgi:SPX domain protein involved in polyphosphate accumulation
MKFGQQYDFHKIPEWSENYLDYDYLKKSLKALTQTFKSSKNFINKPLEEIH